ncbi:MAG: bifunctional folylpolyglutamate synthase/dihydrofolate synthase [Muribaculaceae bacterium]|nr:bifunctional folylpolyglutamate synthase/dihydrofolate synthase [Muribaculaceae bacterium]
MDYNESIQYLFSRLPMFSRVGAAAYKPGLETSERLDAFFGHPHRRFRSIHVAGTNGKGSCSHTLAAILQEAGYRTGLYTSPHLADFRERMRVDGEMIERHEVVDFVERYRNSGYEGSPSFFELTMMMAFDFFARREVDFAVVEVGMGGRLDSTNIITPEGCVITNISLDHTQFLGDTLPKIAGEKAGIIKAGIPVTVGEAEGEVREVFERKAAEVGAPITFAQDYDPAEITRDEETGKWRIQWRGRSFLYPLAGEYQKANIRTVLTAVEMLQKAGIEIPDEAVVRGMEQCDKLTGLRGRWMELSQSPLTIADTGHNEAGLNYNMAQLKRLMAARPKDARLRIVCGFVADKDVDHILRLFPKNAEYYFTQAQIPRALPVDKLLEKASQNFLIGRAYHTVKEAYEAAHADAAPHDLLYVGGSTFIVADLLLALGL